MCFKDAPRSNFDEVTPPARGRCRHHVWLGADCAGGLECTGVGFDSAYTSVSLGTSNGVFQIAFAAYLNAEISVGPLTLDEMSFNIIIIPIPKLSRLMIDIELAPQHTVRFEFMVGYKPYAVFANAFFNGFLPYFYIPFFTAGDFFVEADISKAPTIAFGGTLRFGRDCLDERGRPMESAGCGIARGVVGVGADQFIRLEINNLTIKMLLRSIFGKLTDGVPLGPFGNAGYPGKNIMSFSAAERTLPPTGSTCPSASTPSRPGRSTECSRSHRCAFWSRSRRP